jgi:WD40 repeat protein/DNA-binding SARP family transcriptional activator/tRNA A-37 threonylcarbamoyl transferase component Bud32
VLAHLVLGANHVVPTERLIDALWGEHLPAEPKAALQVYVSRLRSALGADVIDGRPPGYVLHADPDEVDVLRFQALLREAQRSPAEPRSAAQTLDEALDLWRGPALADLSGEPSLTVDIARLEDQRLQATENKIAAELALGRHVEVVGELEHAVATHPLRERVWSLLMLALYRSGRQADALAAYQRARELLGDELGIDPTEELQALHERILRHDPELDVHGEPLRGYRLLERIGEGPSGVVYRAIQPHVGREVAVKAIRPDLANDPTYVRRFEADAQIVARLESPHIVPLYDYWRDPDGAYLVTRYLSGGSLRDRLDGGRAIPPEELAGLVDQIAKGLAAAHRQRVVHGDVKPENVLFDEDGNAYLSDFRIAEEPSDPRTDVQALGTVLVDALTGGDSVRGHLPSSVEKVFARAIADDPADGFADAPSLAAAFHAALDPDVGRAVASSSATNPFKGLRPFVEADTIDFFGREALVQRLVGRLAEPVEARRFLAVVGPSGSGKSSAVRAGLVPALRSGALDGSRDWFYVEMAPGAHPLEELETALLRVATKTPTSLLEQLEADELGLHRAVVQALPNDDAQLVLVVDQLEEVFTLVEDERERRQFLDNVRAAVLAADSRLVVVSTLRADFFDRPLAYRGFAELIRGRTEPVVPLSPEEIERAVAGPAENVGLSVEPALVAQVVADVAEQPGALPLLQYAMTEVFEARTDGVLSARTYREIGGVSGALARRAEHLFGGLTAAGKRAAEQLFLRLVAFGEGTEDTRRRVTRSELDRVGIDGRALDGVVEAYGRHRLLSLDRDPETREPTVEVAHEALLREWGRLREWIDAARDDLRAERRLAAAATEWEAAGRDPSFVLRGSRLEQVSAWAGATGLALGHGEREFLAASAAVADAERAAEEERVERERGLERRSVRRLRATLAVVAVAGLVAAGLTVVANDQRARAGREAARAERQALIASARELAAASVASLETDQQLSVLLAIEAVERSRAVDGTALREAEEALHRAAGASRLVTSIPGASEVWPACDPECAIDWGPGGLVVVDGTFAAEGPRPVGSVDLRDQESGEIVRSLPGHDGEVTGAQFSSDGSMLATTAKDGRLSIWDLSSDELIMTVGGRGDAWSPSFSADGSRVAAMFGSFGEPGLEVRVADLSSHHVQAIRTSSKWVNDIAISPDGRWVVAVSGYSGEGIDLIDVETAEVHPIANPIVAGLTSVAWSPDGRHIAAGTFDRLVPVMNADGRPQMLLEGHNGSGYWVDWSPDGTRLLTGGPDGTARIWAIAGRNGTELQTLSVGAGEITGIAYSPDGNRVLTRSETSVMDVWEVGSTGDAEIANVADAEQIVSFTSQTIVTSGLDGSLTTLDLETGERSNRPIAWFQPPTGLYSSYAFSPDGTSLMVGDYLVADPTVRDVETGAERFTGDWWNGFDWSPDGRFAALNEARSVVIVDGSGRRVGWLPETEFTIGEGVWFGPRDLVAVPSRNEEVDGIRIWDWTRDEILAELPVPAGVEVTRFDPGGDRIAIGTFGTQIWDVESERLLLTLPSSQTVPDDLAFSPDGSRVAEIDPDGVVRVWDTTSGEQVLELRGEATGGRAGFSPAGQVRFSPDGSMLATQAGGMVRIWALDIDDLLEIARGKVTRSLTDEECRLYLHVETCPID